MIFLWFLDRVRIPVNVQERNILLQIILILLRSIQLLGVGLGKYSILKANMAESSQDSSAAHPVSKFGVFYGEKKMHKTENFF